MTVEIRPLEKESMPDTMTVNDAEYRVVKLLGKGKGGYSYLAADIPQERILKEYIAGQTVAELLKEGRMDPGWLRQVQAMCGRLYPAGLNIDYYPTNFVPCGGTLYYIDYECNAYMQEWDFAHWGARYWTIQAPERPDEA